MSAATVITSAMPNVPVLSGTEGSLTALIRYIAPILGWDITFDSGLVIVVRPQSYKGGQALLYRFDDRAARGGAAPRVAEVRAYESMLDINTGAGLVGPVYVHKSLYASTDGKNYYCIGDQYGFYIGTNSIRSSSALTNAFALQYFGFINQLADLDVPVCAVIGNSDTGMGNAWYAVPPTTGSVSYMLLHHDRAGIKNKPCAMISGGGFQCESTGIGSLYNSSETLIGLPTYPYAGECLLIRPALSDGAAGTLSGFLPGLYGWQHTGYPSGLVSLADAPVASVTPFVVGDKSLVAGWAWNTGGSAKDSGRPIWDIGLGFRP